MSNTVTNTAATPAPVAPSIKDAYNGYAVKNKDTKPEIETPNTRFYRTSTLESARTQLAEDVKAVEAAKPKAEPKPAVVEEKWPLWKQIVLFVPVTIPTFVFNTIAGIIGKICSIFGFGKKDEATETSTQTTTTTATQTTATSTPAVAKVAGKA